MLMMEASQSWRASLLQNLSQRKLHRDIPCTYTISFNTNFDGCVQ